MRAFAQDALERNSPRQLRIAFLMHHWHEHMDYRDAVMTAACVLEDDFEASPCSPSDTSRWLL